MVAIFPAWANDVGQPADDGTNNNDTGEFEIDLSPYVYENFIENPHKQVMAAFVCAKPDSTSVDFKAKAYRGE